MTPGPVRRILGGPGRLVRHLAALSESAGYVQYETDAPPRDAPHRTPRADPRTSAGQDLRAWVELLRVSALFTVPGDALAGAASAGLRPNRGTALAVATSLCLYEAGMALNDWADREEDARERPHRPIPSGRITPNAALAAAGGLTATGLFLASRAGRPALAVSTALAASVWAYDLRLKHTAAGPAAMGAARALDVLLGATATHAASRPGSPSGTGGTPGAATPVRPTGALPSQSAASSARFPSPPAGRGVFGRLSAWVGGSTPRVNTLKGKLAGSAPRRASEAAASSARISAPPAGRDALARLSAWADGSNGQGRSAPPVGGLASRLTKSVSEAGASTARLPKPSGGRAALARFSASSVGASASKLAGSAARPASEAAASTTRFSSPPAGQGVFAHLSAWAGGAAPPGRTAARGGSPVAPGAGRHAIPRGALVPAALLGVHTVAVTTVSRREVYGGAVGAPVAALVVTGVLGGVVGRPRDAGVGGLVTAALSAAYAVTAGRAFLHAALNPSPQLTQRAVGGGIRAMIPFQAALASRGGTPVVGLAVMGLVPLARKLAKKVSVT